MSNTPPFDKASTPEPPLQPVWNEVASSSVAGTNGDSSNAGASMGTRSEVSYAPDNHPNLSQMNAQIHQNNGKSALPNASVTEGLRLNLTPAQIGHTENQEAEENGASYGSLQRTASLHRSSLNSEPASAVILDTRGKDSADQPYGQASLAAVLLPKASTVDAQMLPIPLKIGNEKLDAANVSRVAAQQQDVQASQKADQYMHLSRSLSMRTGPAPEQLANRPPEWQNMRNAPVPQQNMEQAALHPQNPFFEKDNNHMNTKPDYNFPRDSPKIGILGASTEGKSILASCENQSVNHVLVPNNPHERGMSVEEVLAIKSFQLRALTRKTLSYQKRQVFVNVCCISLCPLFMVVLSALLGALLQSLVNKSVELKTFAYCSNSDAMNGTTNLPLSSQFPTADSSTLKSLKGSDGLVQLTNFFLQSILDSGGRPLAAGAESCVLWGSKAYNYTPVYERDPFANMENPLFAADFNGAEPQRTMLRKVVRMDTTFRPDPKYGWLYVKSLVQSGALLAQFSQSQTYPWAIVQDNADYDIGTNGRSDAVSYDSAAFAGLANFNKKSGLLGSIEDKIYLRLAVNNTPDTAQQSFYPKQGERVPFFDKYSSGDTNDDTIDNYISGYVSVAIQNLTTIDKTVLYEKDPSPLQQLKYQIGVNDIIGNVPWGAVLFKKIDIPGKRVVLTMQVGTDARLENAGSFPSEGFRRFWLNSMMSSAVMKIIKPEFSITHGLRAMPTVANTKLNLPFGSFIGRILYPFGVSFLLPIFVIILTQEKEERIMVMMKMNGIRTFKYYIAHFIHFYLMHTIVSLVFIFAGVASDLDFFTQTSPSVYIILFIVWGLVQISLAFFISAFFSKSRSALVISFLLVLLNVIINVSSDTLFTDRAPWLYLLWPPFAFYRVLSLVNKAAYTTALRPYTLSLLFNPSDESFSCLLFQLLGVIIFIPLGIYLNKILPSEFGVRKAWHYPITDIINSSKTRQPKLEAKEKAHYIAQVDSTEGQFEDDDVRAERERVDKTVFGPDYPLVIRHMRKIYPGASKTAVKDITLAVEKDTIFGLLGPNGAGKTSLISILTGLYEPTFGEARLGGFDIATQTDCVYKVTGICPQHDILWNDLTVEEHLLFYARVKGIEQADEKKVVSDAIAAVSLENFATRLSKGLSGGEKRRLSIAIALIGNPKAVFFDEPTTGLDPEVRRVIWGIIQSAKKNRTVILTTHSMEEAEVLCQRIGIMAKGTLRCVGPLLRLKKLYGSGFKLIFLAKAEDLNYAAQFVRQILPSDALVIDMFQTSMTFEFSPQKGMLANIFSQLQKNKEQWKIQDWGISQTSLEEVFLKLVSETDAEGTAEEN